MVRIDQAYILETHKICSIKKKLFRSRDAIFQDDHTLDDFNKDKGKKNPSYDDIEVSNDLLSPIS